MAHRLFADASYNSQTFGDFLDIHYYNSGMIRDPTLCGSCPLHVMKLTCVQFQRMYILQLFGNSVVYESMNHLVIIYFKIVSAYSMSY